MTYNYTITPVPYNGGTMSTTIYGYCVMNNQQIVQVTMQATPNAVMASVVNFTSPLSSATNTQTITTTNIITSDTLVVNPQLVKINTTRLAMLYTVASAPNDSRVMILDINGDNTITVSKITTTLTTANSQVAQHTICAIGTNIDTFVVGWRNTGVTYTSLWKFIWTPGTTTLSQTAYNTLVGLASGNAHKLIAIPNSTKCMAFDRNNNANLSYCLDATTTLTAKTMTSSTSLANAPFWLPVSSTQVFSFTSTNTYQIWDTTPATIVLPTTKVMFSPSSGASTVSTLTASARGDYGFGIAIDSSYFAIAYTKSATNYMKVCRILSSDFAETNVNSNTGMGKTTTNYVSGNELLYIDGTSFGTPTAYNTFKVFA